MIDYTFQCPTKEAETALDALQAAYRDLWKKVREGRETDLMDTAHMLSLSRELTLRLLEHLWTLEMSKQYES